MLLVLSDHRIYSEGLPQEHAELGAIVFTCGRSSNTRRGSTASGETSHPFRHRQNVAGIRSLYAITSSIKMRRYLPTSRRGMTFSSSSFDEIRARDIKDACGLDGRQLGIFRNDGDAAAGRLWLPERPGRPPPRWRAASSGRCAVRRRFHFRSARNPPGSPTVRSRRRQ
jgi:hypothetical protein